MPPINAMTKAPITPPPMTPKAVPKSCSGKLGLKMVATIVAQAAKALSTAHAAGELGFLPFGADPLRLAPI